MSRLKARSEFEVPLSIKDKLHEKISVLKIEVGPKEVSVKVLHSDGNTWGYEISFSPHLKRHVAIEAVTRLEGVETTLPEETVRQKYILAALDHLKILFDDLREDNEIDVFIVNVVNDDDNENAEFQADKNTFFTTLRDHFQGMGEKKLNVVLFNIKYSGDEEDEEEMMTFLRAMKLIGNKTLKLESNKHPRGELCLKEVFAMSQWKSARSLLIEEPSWTEMSVDNWLHFTTVNIMIREMDVETVKKIVKNAHTTPDFVNYTVETIERGDPAADIQHYLTEHFEQAYDNEYFNYERNFQVITTYRKWTFDATGIETKDPMKDLIGFEKFIMYLNPTRGHLEVFDIHSSVEWFTPRGSGCWSVRKTRRSNGLMNDYTYKYNIYKKSNYMTKLFERFQMALSLLNNKTCVELFYVSMGCKEGDEEVFRRQKTVFLKLINTAFEKKRQENLEKIPFTFDFDLCFNAKSIMLEYSGAREDEDIPRTFLQWVEVIGMKGLYIQAHPLDNRKRPLQLTDDEDHGVLALNQWDRAKLFFMDWKFYLEAPLDKFMHFRESWLAVKSLSMVQVYTLLKHFEQSETFIACQVWMMNPVPAEQEAGKLLIRGSFQYMNDAKTEFRNFNGFEVKILRDDLYIFEAPKKEDLDLPDDVKYEIEYVDAM